MTCDFKITPRTLTVNLCLSVISSRKSEVDQIDSIILNEKLFCFLNYVNNLHLFKMC